MSQIPSGGPVTIPVAVDAAQAHADMARLRAEWSKPIQLNVQGPGNAGGYNGPGGGGSMAVATQNGPVTFSSQGSSMFVGPGGLGGLIGPAGAVGGGIGMGGVPYTANMGGGAQQLNQAASQLTQAVSQLAQVVGQLGGGAGAAAGAAAGGGGGGAASGGSSAFGLRTTGLARYVGAGFLLHTGLSTAVGIRNASVQESLMGGTPEGRYAAEMSLYNRVSKVPLFGPLADLIVDPSGREHLANERAIQQSQFGEGFSSHLYSLRMQTIDAREAAEARGYIGPARSKVELDNQYRARLREIATARINDPQIKALDNETAMRKLQARIDYTAEEHEFYERPGATVISPKQRAEMEARLKTKTDAADADDRARRGALDKQYASQRDAAEAALKAGYRSQGIQTSRETGEWDFKRQRDVELARQYPSQRKLWDTQRKENEFNANIIREAYGNKAAADYASMEASRLNREQADFAKESARQRFSVQSETESINLQSGRDARTYGMTPGMRGFMADLNSIVRRSQSAIEDALQSGRPDVAETLKARGAANVIGMRRRMLDSFSDEVVSPLQMGGGDLRQMNVDFWKAFNDAQRPGGGPEGGGGGGDNKAVSENTKQTNTKLDQIINLLQGAASKLNINT